MRSLFFLSFLFILPILAIAEERTFSASKSSEKKLLILQSKMEQGEYEEALGLIHRYYKKFHSEPLAQLQVLLFKVELYQAQMYFKRSESALEEACSLFTKMQPGKDKMLSAMHLSQCFLALHRSQEARRYLQEAFSASVSVTDTLVHEWKSLLELEYLIQSGSYAKAEKLLGDWRSATVSTVVTSFYSEKQNKIFATRLWLKRKLLALEMFAARGDDKNFLSLLGEEKQHFRKWAGKSEPSLLALYSLEGKYFFRKQKFNSASNAFYYAYAMDERLESCPERILNLRWLVYCFQKSGDLIHAQSYARRLLMLASQTSGYVDRYQLSYNLSVAYDELWKGNLDLARQRAELTSKEFNHLPVYFPEYRELQFLLTEISLDEGDIRNYRVLLEKTSEELSSLHGKSSVVYHQSLLDVARCELSYGKNFKWVANVLQQSYDTIVRVAFPAQCKYQLECLSMYSELYMKQDAMEAARSKAAEALHIAAALYQRQGPAYAYHLAHAMESHIMASQYKMAMDSLPVLAKLSLDTEDLGEKQKAMLAITSLYQLLGEFDKSAKLIAQANAAARKDVYVRNINLVVQSASRQSALLSLSGNYFKAEKVLVRAQQEVLAALGPGSPQRIPLNEEMISLLILTGNFPQCGKMLEETRRLIDSIYGMQSLAAADFYLRNGDYLLQINDSKGSEESYKNADKIIEKVLGKKHLRRSETLLKLAYLNTLRQGSKFQEVENLYKEALDIIKNSTGKSSPLYAQTLEGYSVLQIRHKQYDKALQGILEADNFWIQKLGTSNVNSIRLEALRGEVFYAKSQYKEAEKSFSEVRKSYRELFNSSHPEYLKVSGKLARTLYMKGEASAALRIMEENIPVYLKFTEEYFPSLSFRQKSKFWNMLREEFEFYTTVVFSRPSSEWPQYTPQVYNNVLNTKALLLSSSIKLLDKILNSDDSLLIVRYNEWIAEKEFLISALSMSKQSLQEQGITISELEANIERLEKEMAQRSDDFSAKRAEERCSWNKVAKSILPNEGAVEVLRFRTFYKTFTDTIRYAALLLKQQSVVPDAVLMQNGNQMEGKYLNYYRNSAQFNTPDQYSYNIYWKKIKEKIGNLSTLYISCDGVYNQINLEMLADSLGVYNLDQNTLILVTNTRDLIQGSKTKAKENKKKESNQFILCGSPEFYTENVKVKNVHDLPGAEKEINEIHQLLTSSSQESWKLLYQQVEEDSVKKVKSPKVLHIATHGYFKEQSHSGLGEDDLANNPLLNSGVLLRGSGDILDNAKNAYVNQKDGILTALEAMDMSLDQTDLVVLSACETGKGSVQAGEGVYGLQRSFLLAGSKAVVISLFKVNDEVTQKLMLSFYERWMRTGDKRLAFIEAKKEIKEIYKKPIYWGAFIMIEGKPE
ncbi:MAG: CHAT domain-containing protein, partial [Cytophagaceae bacterium]|nr:CHAT domain-containing protein [Cytophagaceae bacterium]